MKRFLAFLAAALTVLVPFTSSLVAAASASMSLSVSSSSVAKGSYLTVYIRENSGSEPVNAAQANFSYPSNLLQYSSISNSSAFSVVAQNSAGGGSVNIGRGALPSVSGSQLIASVTFKALTDSGTASFGFTGGSSVVSANSNTDIAASKTGTSARLVVPVPPAPKDTTPPTISKVSVKDVSTNTATITWTTSEPATSEIDYGFTTGYGLSATNGNLTTDHSIVLSSALVIPATTYHFVVKSADQAGNSASSSNQAFTTAGIPITVLVMDEQSNKPVVGARVAWNNEISTTNTQGRATLQNLPAGTTTIVVRVGGNTFAQTVAVSSTQPGKIQLVAIKVSAVQTTLPWLVLASIAGLIVVAAAGIILTKKITSAKRHSRPRMEPPPKPFVPAAQSSGVIRPASHTYPQPGTPPADERSRLR